MLKRANSVQDSELDHQLLDCKKSKNGSPSPERGSGVEKYNHLLIATVKDTNIMFSFYVEASVIEPDRNSSTAIS